MVAAPGSETDVVLAAIYLRPGTVPLLDRPWWRGCWRSRAQDFRAARLRRQYPGRRHRRHGAGIRGLSVGRIAEGRVFAAEGEAVAGAVAPVAIGESFHAEHGREEERARRRMSSMPPP